MTKQTIKAEMYPIQSANEVNQLYDEIATELYELIELISGKLEIPQSNIRISCDNLWKKKGERERNIGLALQIKPSTITWDTPRPNNNIIIQTPGSYGVVIYSGIFGGGKIEINGCDAFRNLELRDIFIKAHDLDLDKLVVEFNKYISDFVGDNNKLIAPNRPVIITGN